MKSWLRIATAVACGVVQAAAADAAGARLHRHRPQPAGARSAIRRCRRTAATWSTCSARPTSTPTAAAPTCGWWTSTSAKPKPRRLTQHSANDTHPRWAVDGTSIYFLSSRTGSQQIWRLPLTGGEAVQITDYPLDVGTFRFSRGGGRIALSMEVFPDCADLKCTRDAARRGGQEEGNAAASSTACSCATGIPGTTGTRSNLFVAPVNADGRAGTPVNVSQRARRRRAVQARRRRRGIHVQPRRRARGVQRARRGPRRSRGRRISICTKRRRTAAPRRGTSPPTIPPGTRSPCSCAMATSPGSR